MVFCTSLAIFSSIVLITRYQKSQPRQRSFKCFTISVPILFVIWGLSSSLNRVLFFFWLIPLGKIPTSRQNGTISPVHSLTFFPTLGTIDLSRLNISQGTGAAYFKPPWFTNDIPHFSSYFQSYCTEYNILAKLATIEVVQVFYHMYTYPLCRYNIRKYLRIKNWFQPNTKIVFTFTFGCASLGFHLETLVRASVGIMGSPPSTFTRYGVSMTPHPHIYDKNRIQVSKRSLIASNCYEGFVYRV